MQRKKGKLRKLDPVPKPQTHAAHGTFFSPELLNSLYTHIPVLFVPQALARCGSPRGTQQPASGRDAPSPWLRASGQSTSRTRRARNRPWARRKARFRQSPRNAAPAGAGARLSRPVGARNTPPSFAAPLPARPSRGGRSGPGGGERGAPRSAGTLAAGAALQDDDRRSVQPLRAAAGGAQPAQVGVGSGVAAAHRLAAGAHAEAGLRAPPHRGRGGHAEGYHALQPFAARALLQAALGPLRRAAHLAAAARVADAAALAVCRRRSAARGLAALGTPGCAWRREHQQQQQQRREERGARGLHGGSDGGGRLSEGRSAAPGREREGLGASGRERARPRGPAHWPRGGDELPWGRALRPGGGPAGWREGGRAAGPGTARGGGRAGAPGHGGARGRGRGGSRVGPPARGASFPGLRFPCIRLLRLPSPRFATLKLKRGSARGNLRLAGARAPGKVPANCRVGDPPGLGRGRCPDPGRWHRLPRSRALEEEDEHHSGTDPCARHARPEPWTLCSPTKKAGPAGLAESQRPDPRLSEKSKEHK